MKKLLKKIFSRPAGYDSYESGRWFWIIGFFHFLADLFCVTFRIGNPESLGKKSFKVKGMILYYLKIILWVVLFFLCFSIFFIILSLILNIFL